MFDALITETPTRETKNHKYDDKMEVIKYHPCFSTKAVHRFGRIHLPVAPECNIMCKYCVRKYDCVNESRPGVTSKILFPEKAAAHLDDAIRKHPYIKTIGFAGPGDPLASPQTFETMALIRPAFPGHNICLSTNGLMLAEKLDMLLEYQVATLTVTLNTLDPDIGKIIYKWVRYGNKIYKGREGATLLIDKQLDGISAAVSHGIVVKINTVLIPSINDGDMNAVAERAAKLGVFMQNIIPLIPQGGFRYLSPPTASMLNDARDSCESRILQMRHCRQCRADAVGLLVH